MSKIKVTVERELEAADLKASNINCHLSYICITLTFSYLADATSNEDNGSNQNQQKSNDTQVLWQVSFSLMQYM